MPPYIITAGLYRVMQQSLDTRGNVLNIWVSWDSCNTLYNGNYGPFFFSGEGPPSRRYGRTAALRLLVQPCDEDDDDDDYYYYYFFCPFPSNGAPVEWNWQEKTEVLGEKPVPVPLCPPQIPRGLTRDRIRASGVGRRRLTVWAMARPTGLSYEVRNTF
jgi:hypothetical protein